MSQNTVISEEITALLGKGTRFEGKLIFEGTVRIDGEFSGEVFTRDTLILGENSKVKAQIEADTVVVAGNVIGDISASSRVEIQSSGSVKGAVKAPVFKIEEGGMFDGSTAMIST